VTVRTRTSGLKLIFIAVSVGRRMAGGHFASEYADHSRRVPSGTSLSGTHRATAPVAS
jgi:hypothetical protein